MGLQADLVVIDVLSFVVANIELHRWAVTKPFSPISSEKGNKNFQYVIDEGF